MVLVDIILQNAMNLKICLYIHIQIHVHIYMNIRVYIFMYIFTHLCLSFYVYYFTGRGNGNGGDHSAECYESSDMLSWLTNMLNIINIMDACIVSG
jgi:hypothetical protein